MTIPSHERQFGTAKENKSVRTGHIRLPALANDAHSRYMYMKDVREVSVFLIAVMPVMFIPAAVGLIDAWGDIRSNLLQYVVVTVVSTFVVMAAAGWVTQYVVKGRKGKE